MSNPFDLADEHSPSILVAVLVLAYNRLADQDCELARDTVAQCPRSAFRVGRCGPFQARRPSREDP